ncbi:MAG: ABC transporter substrate-binding protein [Acidobacteria bacterium]|nr:MAG: ABC transporter substrate-binding protein [Acidobacteriota bacterium]
MKKTPQEISVAHSPDSDDAFMFYALATHKVGLPGVKFKHVLSDIEDLNRRALAQEFDVTAVSFHAYPYLQDNYRLLNHGGSVGYGYGPMIVAARPITPEEVRGKTIAIAGERTTSALVLRLWHPEVKTTVIPFDQIIPAIVEGRVEAGLLIHEGQLTYSASGLHKVLDLGRWWLDSTQLPLPLGGNVVRRALPKEFAAELSTVLKASIQYGLEHRDEALAYAHQFARDMDDHLADQFVGMYVNERTLRYGEDDKRAIAELLRRGHAAGMIPHEPKLDFLD